MFDDAKGFNQRRPLKDVQNRIPLDGDFRSGNVLKNSKSMSKINRLSSKNSGRMMDENRVTASKRETKRSVSETFLLELGAPSKKCSDTNMTRTATKENDYWDGKQHMIPSRQHLSNLKSRDGTRGSRSIPNQERLSRNQVRFATRSHSNHHSFTAPIPSISRPRYRHPASSQLNRQASLRPTTSLYQKQSRSIDSSRSSRRRSNSGPSMRNQEVVMKKQSTIMTRAPKIVDRIKTTKPTEITHSMQQRDASSKNQAISIELALDVAECNEKSGAPGLDADIESSGLLDLGGGCERNLPISPQIDPPARDRDLSPKKQTTTLAVEVEVTDRIEESRDPVVKLQNENSPLRDLDATHTLSPISTGASAIAEEEILQFQPDLIECSRNDTNKNSEQTKTRTKMRRCRDRSKIHSQSQKRREPFERKFFPEGDGNSMGDHEHDGSHREYPKTTKVQPHGTNLVSPTASLQSIARSLYSQDFQSLQTEYSESVRTIVAKNDATQPLSIDTKNRPMFVIRSRGLLDSEVQRGDFSIIDIPQQSSSTLALYETNMLPDQKTLDLKAHVFKFDSVFSEKDSFDDFYSRSVQRNLNDAINGGFGAIVLFGSDRVGKSQTHSAIEKRVALDLFSDPSISHGSVSVQYLGLGPYNDLCIDLLSPVHHFVEVIDLYGRYQAEGASEIEISSASMLLDTLSRVQQRLASERVLRRESESSSYSFCRIMIRNGNLEPGLLNLVLCPSGDEVCSLGANSNFIDVNPLANLMELLRIQTSTQSDLVCDPPRPCNLTRLLGQSLLDRKEPKVCLVAAVSPSSDDTDATLLTLLSSKEYMTRMERSRNRSNKTKFSLKTAKEKSDLELPRQWSKIELLAWLKKKNLFHASVEGDLSGKLVMKMSKVQLRDCFYCEEENGEYQANMLFNALRAENDRVSRLRVKRQFALRKAEKS